MVMSSAETSGWANFGSDGPFVATTKKKKSGSNRTHRKRTQKIDTSTAGTSNTWMSAPVVAQGSTPLAPPSTSPTSGSAFSKARWTTTIPVQSARSPASKLAARKKFATSQSPCSASRYHNAIDPSFALEDPKEFLKRDKKTSSLSREKNELSPIPKVLLVPQDSTLTGGRTVSMSASSSSGSGENGKKKSRKKKSSKTNKVRGRTLQRSAATKIDRRTMKKCSDKATSPKPSDMFSKQSSHVSSASAPEIGMITEFHPEIKSVRKSKTVAEIHGTPPRVKSKTNQRNLHKRSSSVVVEIDSKDKHARTQSVERKRSKSEDFNIEVVPSSIRPATTRSSSYNASAPPSPSRQTVKSRARAISEGIETRKETKQSPRAMSVERHGRNTSAHGSEKIIFGKNNLPASSKTNNEEDKKPAAKIKLSPASAENREASDQREPNLNERRELPLAPKPRRDGARTAAEVAPEGQQLTKLERMISRGRATSQLNDSKRRASSKEKSSAVRRPSRGRSDTPVKQKTDADRGHPERKSRGRTPTPASAVESRGRSTSKSGSVRSLSRSSRGRPASRSRPPLTKENTRARNRTRSASLTRVSNLPVSPSAKSSRTALPPTATCRAFRELRDTADPSCRTRSEGDSQSVHSLSDVNIGRDITFDASSPDSKRTSQNTQANRKGGILAKLFGDQVHKPGTTRIVGSLGYEIRPRILLAATVYHNTATSLWIATINTNQRGVAKNPAKANKFLKAFSFGTEREARESAIANAPPKMVPFSESPACFMCKGMFAVFRRASHCRNCGVCVCSSCSTNWPSNNLPETYNLKHEAQLRVCRSCNSLSASFKRSLVDGDLDEAMALYATGNVNLRTCFAASSKKDELMYPVHCAAEGGNLEILRWLIDEHFCPVKIHGTDNGKKQKRGIVESPILTSKGRSILNIALENAKVDIMRYLVVECGNSIYECKDLKNALSALEAALIALPYPTSQRAVTRTEAPSAARWDQASFDDNFSEPSSLGADDYFCDDAMTVGSRRSRASSRGDSCIICCDRKINCVATPCGHQVCCLLCSTNLTTCPVCNDRTNYIKIFRP